MANDAFTTIVVETEFVHGAVDSALIELTLRGTNYTAESTGDGNYELVIPQSDTTQIHYLDIDGGGVMHDAVKFPLAANASTTTVYASISGRNEAITFDSAVGGTFQNTNSYNRTSVTVPAEAFRFGDGTVATGEIQVQITEADIDNLSASGSWANNLYGINDVRAVEDAAPLITYGMAEFYFSQNGRELQLRDGFSATLKWDLPTATIMDTNGRHLPAEVGDNMPLWYYDHEQVVWVDEGALAYVVEDTESPTGFALAGEVTHFSHYNTDRPCPDEITVVSGGCPEGYIDTTTTTTTTQNVIDSNGNVTTEQVSTSTTVRTSIDCGPWNTIWTVDARINLIVVDQSTGEPRNLTPVAWNATIQRTRHYLTLDDRVDGYYRVNNVASGISTVFWDGGTSTSNDVSNLHITISINQKLSVSPASISISIFQRSFRKFK